ncbi:MAG: helix-turn-helix domain-containing protein [Gammaproteobacteria bacterium]|nr:helix-turn-helix domain-containing protein [Gammaproteobacteria bacterium]
MMPDNAITGVLNRLGKRTATRLTWTPARVCAFRNTHHVPVYKVGEREARGEMTPEEVSNALGVSVSKVRKMIKLKILPANQVCTGAPWLIKKDVLALKQVQQAITSTVSAPLTPDSKQQPLKLQ